jgi:hypothetical protein
MTTWKSGQIKVTYGGVTPSAAPPDARPAAFVAIRAAVEAQDYARAGELSEAALASASNIRSS